MSGRLLNTNVLLRFASDAHAEGTKLEALLAGEGCSPKTGEDVEAALRSGCRALVLVVSAGAAASPVVLRDVERAAAFDLPIIPLRLDAKPLSKSLAYYIEPIGAADATRDGLEAAAENVIGALRRVKSQTISGARDWDEFLTYGSPPRFRPQSAFQRWLSAGLAITLALGLAGAFCDAAALVSSAPNYRLVRWFSNTSGGISGFIVWFVALWFYRAHRNLVALGEIRLRFKTRGLIWRLIVPPVNFIGSAAVIREIVKRSSRAALFPRWLGAVTWSWPALFLSLWIHSSNTNTVPPRPDTPQLLWAELFTNLVQSLCAPLVMRIISRVAEAQALIRARQTTPAAKQQLLVPSGEQRPVLISAAEQDLETAKVICEALDAAGIPSRLASRDESGDVEAVDLFSAVVLVVSDKLGGSDRTFREYERAIQQRVPIVPYRLDRSALPERFGFIRVVHWVGDEVASFGAQIERIRATVFQLPVKPVPADGTWGVGAAASGPPAAHRSSLLRFLFYGAAMLYSIVAVAGCIFDLAGVGAGVGAFSFFLIHSRSLFLTLATARASAGVISILLYFWWWVQSKESVRMRWSAAFLAALIAGYLSPVAWDFFDPVAWVTNVNAKWLLAWRLHLPWLWSRSISILAASACDFLTTAISLSALRDGLQQVVKAGTRKRMESLDRRRAQSMRSRVFYEPLWFARQGSLTRWIGRTSVLSVLLAALLGLTAAGQSGPEAQQQRLTAWAIHLTLIPAPMTVLFVVWVATAFRNLSALGMQTEAFTAKSAVTGLVAPFLSLCLAIPILDDLAIASSRVSTVSAGRRLIRCWYLLLVGYWSAMYLRLGSVLSGKITWISTSEATVVLLWAAACVATCRLVATVNTLQMAIWGVRSRSG